MQKLVRTHNITTILLRRHIKNNLFLYAPIALDECHASFSFVGAQSRCEECEASKISKWKILVHSGIRNHNPRMPHPLDQPGFI